MWRYKLMRGTVNGLERGSHVVFKSMRWGIDRLERRARTREPAVAATDHADGVVAENGRSPDVLPS